MSEWIDIKFALPASNYCKCIVFDGCVYTAWFHRFKNGKISWYSSPRKSRFDKVTHWMPLPKPPKEENKC